jgi:hypothetical protein
VIPVCRPGWAGTIVIPDDSQQRLAVLDPCHGQEGILGHIDLIRGSQELPEVGHERGRSAIHDAGAPVITFRNQYHRRSCVVNRRSICVAPSFGLWPEQGSA